MDQKTEHQRGVLAGPRPHSKWLGYTQACGTVLPALARGVHTELWDCTEWTGSAPQSKPTGLEETVSPSWARQNLPLFGDPAGFFWSWVS